MFCPCTTVIRILLAVLNGILLVLSILIIYVGVFLLKEGGNILKLIKDYRQPHTVLDPYQIPDTSDVTELPFGPFITLFLVSGIILLLVSVFGLVAAIFPLKVIMIVFVIVALITTGLCILVAAAFQCEDCEIHKDIKRRTKEKLTQNYKLNSADVFSSAVNALHFALECCGITGPEDFKGNRPASCCNSTIVTGGNKTLAMGAQCMNHTAPDEYYFKQGCYDKMRDFGKKYDIIAGYIVIVVIQISEAALGIAYLVLRSFSNKGMFV